MKTDPNDTSTVVEKEKITCSDGKERHKITRKQKKKESVQWPIRYGIEVFPSMTSLLDHLYDGLGVGVYSDIHTKALGLGFTYAKLRRALNNKTAFNGVAVTREKGE
tara:strand:- start:5757 stop:6077 length:321 start_codon:yes stop_codon:yes gene_type:complete